MKCKNSYLKSGKLNVCVSCVYGHTYLFFCGHSHKKLTRINFI